ncbi:MAG TPA: TlpA disulfide reductase family protein [Verrucomicrobiae bacterium]|nr:TlpA disulfide reductase family protein [Verrucomicrobiae bacterium]
MSIKFQTLKRKLLLLLAIAALLQPGHHSFAADATTELNALIKKVNADLTAGKRTEAELADDLKQYDTLLAEHKGEKTDAVAQILYMKAVLYHQVLNDDAKAQELLTRLKTDFKGTSLVAELEKQEAAQAVAKKMQDSLVIGAKFPDFTVTGLNGKPLSVANDKGNVVLVDFWATWCGPCVAEMPNVIAAYQKYHSKGFDIIGVSLDQEKSALTKYIKNQNVTWPQFFDGKGWSNELAVKYGIQSIPSNFLLDSNGKIIGTDLRGDALDKAVAAALAKN